MPRVYSKRKGAEKPPPDAVYVGRGSDWGNPFVIGKDGTRGEVIARFRRWFLASPGMIEGARESLRGKDLVCWCAPLACHADVLMEVANSDDPAPALNQPRASQPDDRKGPA